MSSSTKAQIQETRRELVACGVDPFELVAQLLVRNEELHEQVEMLQRIVNRR
jgi:phosphoribosylformylglycinamidine (FGAM) synthase-like enzyme